MRLERHQQFTRDRPDLYGPVTERQPNESNYVLLHPTEAHRCITISLIGYLKDSMDILLAWPAPSPVAQFAQEAIPEKVYHFHFNLL
jgi:hypothetical protein